MFALSQTRLLNVIAAGALAAIAFVNTPVAAGGADAKCGQPVRTSRSSPLSG
jgi:hypothetical protein